MLRREEALENLEKRNEGQTEKERQRGDEARLGRWMDATAAELFCGRKRYQTKAKRCNRERGKCHSAAHARFKYSLLAGGRRLRLNPSHRQQILMFLA